MPRKPQDATFSYTYKAQPRNLYRRAKTFRYADSHAWLVPPVWLSDKASPAPRMFLPGLGDFLYPGRFSRATITAAVAACWSDNI